MDERDNTQTIENPVYVGTKLIKAVPMDEITFLCTVKKEIIRADRENAPGYKVTYPDGYVSWSPRAVFENAYRRVTPGELNLFK